MPTNSFAQFPLFIVDHPFWEADHPLRPRNVRDQAVFNRLFEQAERQRNPDGGLPLTSAFTNCLGVYLLEQCFKDSFICSVLTKTLLEYIFGESGGEEDFSTEYYWALMEKGILRKETIQLDKDADAWKEAAVVLGDEINGHQLTRRQFKDLIFDHESRFEEGGKVRDWLRAFEETKPPL